MRYLCLALGWVSLALGFIGAVLPVMPTVPFLIVAVWAFSRSSHRLRDRILHHPQFGPPIRAWQERGVITRMTKIWATLAMACGVGWGLWLGLDLRLVAAQATICTLIAAYLITRPET